MTGHHDKHVPEPARGRLLVVDDEPQFAEFVRRVAESLGYEVAVTHHAHQFQDAYQKVDPTVIVLDVVMPDIDGVELIGWLAERDCRAELIVVTGFDESYLGWAERLGAANGLERINCFSKPVRLRDLRSALM